MVMALLRFLRNRQQSTAICEHTRLQCKVFKQFLRPRCIPLGSVLGHSGIELLQDHVLIGFSYDGPYLISYKTSGPFFDREFSLHWWLVDFGRPLKLVKSCNLFEGFSFFRSIDTSDFRSTDLKLCVCQKDEENVFVFGYEYNKDDSEAKDFYISIVSPPPSNPAELNRDQASPSVHLKYQVLPPYPVFSPTLSLQLQGIILVNTGCTIVAIEKSRSHPLPSLSPLSAGGVGCTIVHQSFLLPREDNSSTSNLYSAFTSPSQTLLPVEVYHKERALVEVSLPPCSLTDPEMRVYVSQYCFDIEPWLISTLEDILFKTVRANLSSLNDYEMRICDVCPEDKIVYLLVKVNAASYSEGTPLYQGYSIKLMCEWDLLKNEARLVSHSCPFSLSLNELHKPLDGHFFEIDKSDLIIFYSQVHVLTNSSVVSSGKSLPKLDHHYLPLCLVYSEPN